MRRQIPEPKRRKIPEFVFFIRICRIQVKVLSDDGARVASVWNLNWVGEKKETKTRWWRSPIALSVLFLMFFEVYEIILYIVNKPSQRHLWRSEISTIQLGYQTKTGKLTYCTKSSSQTPITDYWRSPEHRSCLRAQTQLTLFIHPESSN